MIDIYLEDLLGALFLHGYDRVDGILYSKVIDDVTSEGTKFRFLGRGCSEEFSKIFHYDGFAYFVDGDLDFTPNEEDIKNYEEKIKQFGNIIIKNNCYANFRFYI